MTTTLLMLVSSKKCSALELEDSGRYCNKICVGSYSRIEKSNYSSAVSLLDWLGYFWRLLFFHLLFWIIKKLSRSSPSRHLRPLGMQRQGSRGEQRLHISEMMYRYILTQDSKFILIFFLEKNSNLFENFSTTDWYLILQLKFADTNLISLFWVYTEREASGNKNECNATRCYNLILYLLHENP